MGISEAMKQTETTSAKVKKPASSKAAAPKKAAKPAAKPVLKKVSELQEYILATLDSDKALDIVAIPLKGKTTIADYMLIATGTSSRHVSGMAAKLRDKLSTELNIKARVEGLESGDWAIVDAGDVMVHLFREEVREFYDLEKLSGALIFRQ